MSQADVHAYARPDTTLKDVLTWQGLNGLVGVTYGVDAARFVRVDGERLVGFDGTKEFDLSLDVPYEARIFGEHFEMRWVHQRAGKGRAVVIADGKRQPAGWEEVGQSWLKPLERRYLLWEVNRDAGTGGGWTCLASRRVGTMWIPGTFNTDHVCLVAHEYPAEHEDGNVAIVAERYVGLEEYRSQTGEPHDEEE